jgi:HK97 family phage major capsid protein
MPYQLTEIQQKRESRRKIGEDVRALYAKAREEKRDLSAEESAKVDAMLVDGTALKATIERMERADGLLEDLNASARTAGAIDPAEDVKPENHDAALEKRGIGTGPRDSKEYRGLFRRFLGARSNAEAITVQMQANDFLARSGERRDLSTDNDAQAGFLVPPEQMVNEIIQDLDKATFLRTWARSFVVRQAKSLGAPKRTARASTWVRGSELATPTKDTTLAYGKRELHPRYASGEIDVSRDFMRSSLMDPEAIVRAEIVRDGAYMLEQEYLTGSGAGGAGLGVFTASADGISTARDVSTGNTTTTVTVAGLRAAKYAVRAVYWPGLRWVGSQEFHKQVYGMVDGDGRPLFVESLKIGELDRVLSFPIFISEFAPATFTTGQYVAVLGDWYWYWIADALDMEIQRLDELLARSNQVGFIARLKTDSMPVLEEPWARVKLG